MAKYNVFNDRSVERISANVKWGEGVRNKGVNTHNVIYKPQSERIYVQLTEKDQDDYGYWKAEEVKLTSGSWEILDNGRKFDGTDYPFIRHTNWEDSVLGAIVEVYQIADIEDEDKPYIWVFEEELTNPEAFIFYADATGNVGQSTGADTWTMHKGGMIYTNHGEMEIPDGYQMPAGKTAYAKITFINFGGDWLIADAQMTIEGGDYWEDKGSTLIVRVKIASTEIKKDICRLSQHQAGDIRFELFNDVTVSSGNDWIGVVNNNNNYVVSHLLPGATYHQDEFLAMFGECDDVPTDSFESFIYWFVQNLVHLRYDQLGHIYQREECYGEIEDYTDDDDDGGDVKLAGTLTAANFTSDLQPWALSGGNGFIPKYKVLNGAKNYTDYVGTQNMMIFTQNSLNQIVKIVENTGAIVPNFQVNRVDKAKNVDGTSGLSYAHMFLDVKNFRFNDNLTIKAGVVGKGLASQVVLATGDCSTGISYTEDIRDFEDPNATGQTFQITAGVAAVGPAGYQYEVTFRYSDGTPCLYRLGYNGAFTADATRWAIGAGGTTNTEPIQFDFREGVEHGDVVQMTAKLIYPHEDGSTTYANSERTVDLYIAQVSECMIDEDGEHLVDEDSSDCFVDVDQEVYMLGTDSVGTSVTLTAGNYRMSWVSGAFEFIAGVAWRTDVKVSVIGATGLLTIGGGEPSLAEAEAKVAPLFADITIPSDGSYNFACDDTFYGDNAGAMTVKLVRL